MIRTTKTPTCYSCGSSVSVPNQGDPYCTNPDCGKRVALCGGCGKSINNNKKFCSAECRDGNPQYRQKSAYKLKQQRVEEDYSIAQAIKATLEDYRTKKFNTEMYGAWELYCEFYLTDYADVFELMAKLIAEKINEPNKKKGAIEAIKAMREAFGEFKKWSDEEQDKEDAAYEASKPKEGSPEWTRQEFNSRMNALQHNLNQVQEVMNDWASSKAVS